MTEREREGGERDFIAKKRPKGIEHQELDQLLVIHHTKIVRRDTQNDLRW